VLVAGGEYALTNCKKKREPLLKMVSRGPVRRGSHLRQNKQGDSSKRRSREKRERCQGVTVMKKKKKNNESKKNLPLKIKGQPRPNKDKNIGSVTTRKIDPKENTKKRQ